MVRFSLRLPTDLYAAIVAQAHEQHRSTNAQIVSILEAATKTDWVAEDHTPAPGGPKLVASDWTESPR